jgi:hypothetical protein
VLPEGIGWDTADDQVLRRPMEAAVDRGFRSMPRPYRQSVNTVVSSDANAAPPPQTPGMGRCRQHSHLNRPR